MGKKKILMVHNFYQIGGGEHTVFKNEVDLLREHGHEVIEYTRNNNELKKSILKLALLPITSIWSVKTYLDVRKIIKEKKIDVVHCHNTFPLISPSVYYAARSAKVPVIQTIHNFRFLCPNGTFFCKGKICELCNEKHSFKYAIKNKCYRNSIIQTAVMVMMLKIHRWLGTYNKISYIFLTEFNKEKFSELIDIESDNVFIKPNFVAKRKITTESKRSIKKFVFSSRLDENKGIRFLIEQWKNLPEDYELHIYGDGPLKSEVEKAVTGYRNIVYKGFQPQNNIFHDLLDAAAVVFPSMWYEGFPMIIAESMAIGCPVLSSDIGNQAALVKKSQGGTVFNFDKEDSFRNALEDIYQNREQYSQNCLQYYKKYLSSENNYKKLSDIYDKAKFIS